jgi:cell wall-associated NlpC family hydrolase
MLAETHLQRVSESDARPGDVLLFQFGKVDQHAGILSADGRMIHAHDAAGGVVEHMISASWRRRITGIYRFVIKTTY